MSEQKIKLILDTFPPLLEIVSPKPGEVFQVDKQMQIIIKTETESILKVDGARVNKIISNEGHASIYSFSYIPDSESKQLTVESTDKAGNVSTKVMRIVAKKQVLH